MTVNQENLSTDGKLNMHNVSGKHPAKSFFFHFLIFCEKFKKV